MGEEGEEGVLLPDQVYQEPSHGGSLPRHAGRGRGGRGAGKGAAVGGEKGGGGANEEVGNDPRNGFRTCVYREIEVLRREREDDPVSDLDSGLDL